jgi:tetratricopeptide (TPR) repeat protein
MFFITPETSGRPNEAHAGALRRWPQIAALMAGIAVLVILILAVLFVVTPDPSRRMLDEIDVLMAGGDWQQAEALCRRRIAKQPDASRPGHAGAASSWTGSTDAAAELSLRLGISLSMQERYDEAARVLDEAIARSPQDPRLALNRALVDYRAGKLDDSLARLRGLAKQAPYVPNVNYHIGRIYEAKGLWDNALGAYRDELNISSSAAAWERYLVVKKMRGATTTRPASGTQAPAGHPRGR